MFKKLIIILTIFSLVSILKCPNTAQQVLEDKIKQEEEKEQISKFINYIDAVIKDMVENPEPNIPFNQKTILDEAIETYDYANPPYLTEDQKKFLKEAGIKYLKAKFSKINKI